MRYRCIPPEAAIAKLKRDFESECDEVLNELNEIYAESTPEKTEEMMWTINGARNVIDKVIQMLEGAETDILILSSSTPFRTLAEKYTLLKKEYTTLIGILNRKISDDNITVRLISSGEEEGRKLKRLIPLASIRVDSTSNCPACLKSFVVAVDNSEILVDIIKEEDGKQILLQSGPMVRISQPQFQIFLIPSGKHLKNSLNPERIYFRGKT
ncbi:MAG: hypothetical protein R2741_14455 [Methanolobus sp.]